MADFRLVSTQLHLNYITDEHAFVLDPGTSEELALSVRDCFSSRGHLYDWAEARFTPVPETVAP